MFGLNDSPKQEYEKLTKKLRKEDIKNKRIIIDENVPNVYFPSTKETFRFYKRDGYEEVTVYPKNYTISRALEEWFREQRNEVRRHGKIQEDEIYTNKLKKLIKVSPLDKDLQESFKKANRILEIGKQITELTKEIYKLRK